MKKVNLSCKVIEGITLIPVSGHRITIFSSAIEKERFRSTHADAQMLNNAAMEPLYLVADLTCGFTLSESPITYNESITVIKHYL